MAYLVTYGIAPDFHQALIDFLHEKDFYSILFDESFNKTLQEEQMDVLVRYWHVDHVITRYFGSAFLGHTRAEDFLVAINQRFYQAQDNLVKNQRKRDDLIPVVED